ncbi:hypothetical protein DY000_02034873 [Brassica cretica]|uniref:Myb-like domain-containing protein n=1 Tax=Brassica cretica TaxID=69181 RepID=A0ABQ7DMN2_BRACR|nr:hypothetical protein DY000_02034873 [Brassica cretica]
MTRRCSHCSNNGHNSRTCPTRGSGRCGGLGGSFSSAVKLFGVRLTDGSIIKKSATTENHSDSPLSDHARYSNQDNEGYLSDDPARGFGPIHRRVERKRVGFTGVPWTEEEHRLFVVGLRKLGKGDWRGISRNYVMSRTPTQVKCRPLHQAAEVLTAASCSLRHQAAATSTYAGGSGGVFPTASANRCARPLPYLVSVPRALAAASRWGHKAAGMSQSRWDT